MAEKLVRDHIPRIILADTGKCYVRVVTDRVEHLQLIEKKFEEELGEFFAAKDEHEKTRELVDLLEVIRGWCEVSDRATFEQLVMMAKEKRRQKGGFGAGLVLTIPDEKTAR